MFFREIDFYKKEKDYHGIAPAQIKNSPLKQFYFEQLSKCKGKIVNDIGAGNGILSIKASMFGAKKVNAFETNDDVAALLTYSLKQLKLANVFVRNTHISGHELFDGVIVCEMINLSFRNNTFPEFMMNIAKANPDVEFIPNSFTYTGRIVKDADLDSRVDWGYDEEINTMFNETMLCHLIHKPILRYNRDKKAPTEVSSSIELISYNFGCRNSYSNVIRLPFDKNGLWLEINWKLDHSFVNDGVYWPIEYIPLFDKDIEKCSTVELVPDGACHKLKFS